MQKNKVKAAKRITALLMSVILLATSMPLIVAQAAGTGEYNPAPTWAKDNRGVSAYTDEAGGIVVDFPAAQPNKTHRTQKEIEGYMLELVDLGANNEAHTENVILQKFVTPQGEGPYEAYFTPEEVQQAVSQQPEPAGLNADHRYNVTVTAVDSDHWFSKELYSIVSNVPRFLYDEETYAPILNFDHAMREMMRFEDRTDKEPDGTKFGDQLQLGGIEEQTGVESATADVDTKALRMRIIGMPTGTQGVDTAFGRETWDYTGAEQVWFWLDLSQVDLQGISFRLRSNEKWWSGWADGKTVNESYTGGDNETINVHGTVFSTIGYTKATAAAATPAYAYIQRADGGWEKREMKNGTLDLGHFKGYVRIPIEFFCTEAPTTIDATNLLFTEKNGEHSASGVNKYLLPNRPVEVDPAGTCITNALLLQNRAYKYGAFGGTAHEVGTMLWAGGDADEVKNTTTPNRAYVDEAGTIQNRENGKKAIEDLYSAGVSFTGCSADSVDKAFFIDNVMFYKANDKPYPEVKLKDQPASTGKSVAEYYNQEREIARAIFDACDDYIASPDWSEFRAVAYIEGLIEAYRTGYKANKMDPSFLTDDALTETAKTLGMEESWQNFLKAREECKKAGNDTYGKDNNDENDLVPELEKELEKLPPSKSMIWMSDTMRSAVARIHKIYSKLNLGQLRNLGRDTEENLLSYFAYLDTELLKNILPVGQTLTDKPFIPFADFEEESYEVGQRSWQLENDSQNYNKYDGTSADRSGLDYRFTKNLISYTPNWFKDLAGFSYDTGVSAGSADPTKDGIENGLVQNAAWANVTQNGFYGSKAITGVIDSQRYVDGEGLYNVIGFTYMGADENNFAALRKHNMAKENLGGLAKDFGSADPNPPLCLVAYVDFSELSDFRFTFTISTYLENGYSGSYKTEDFALDMGWNSGDRYFFMLEPTTGEWVRANNVNLAYSFSSEGGYDANGDGTMELTLANYKGYIMVPLYHFKQGGAFAGARGNMLDRNAEALNNIWRVSIGVAPNSNESAAKLDGKTYTIDNVGFSYDPIVYAAEAQGRTDKNFDEIFQAKSLTADRFEQTVSQIDPHSGNLKQEVEAAYALYNTLSAYQQNRLTVRFAKATLDIYQKWADDPLLIPSPTYTPQKMIQEINALPKKAKENDNVIGKQDIPYPGVVVDETADPSALLAHRYRVNYEAYDLTAELCDTIIFLYEKNYKLQSANDQALLQNTTAADMGGMSVKDALVNAYNAAMRCKNLEGHLAQLQAYSDSLHEVYGVVNSARQDLVKDPTGQTSDNFIVRKEFPDGLSTLEKLDALDQQYADMNYCAKQLLNQMPEFGEGATNAPSAARRILKNTQIYTNVAGHTGEHRLAGGIISTIDRYEDLFAKTKAKIDAKQLLTPAELTNLRTEVTAYLDMVQIYYSVGEMNMAMQNILDLFSKLEINKPENLEFQLKETALQQEAAMRITYLQDALRADETKAPYALQITSQGGGLTSGSHTETYTVTLNGTTYTLDQLANKQGHIALDCNIYTPEKPLALTIGVKMDKAPETPGVYTDILKVEAVDKDGNPMKDRYGNPVANASMQIPVSYGAEDSFTVSIPASVDIKWDFKEATDVSYTVNCALRDDAEINVEVKQADTEAPGVMTAEGTTKTLAFTSQNFGKETFTGVRENAKPQNIPTMTVSKWNVPVGEYHTQLTYTVTYRQGGPVSL